MNYQNLPFSTAKDASKATLVMHYSGVGGPKNAFTSQRGPVELFRHGLDFALYKAGFTDVKTVSVFENFPGLDKETVNQIGEELGKKLGLEGSGIQLVGFPFDTLESYHKYNSCEKYYHKATKGVDTAVVSIDYDVLHPKSVIPNGMLAVTMPEGSLLPDDLKMMLRIIGQGEIPVIALLVSELNPTAGPDPDGNSFKLANDIIYDFLVANRRKS